ncbi:hypothetical protein [Sphingomonas sp. 1P08PE]|uniref:hypothetical protein n=1 Tax=Sphingomonas sp. 1P08PE TaxID=554122 RepID=UPI0039A1341D
MEPTVNEAALYTLLADCARRALPCPTNRQMATRLKLNERTVCGMMKSLRLKGLIRVESQRMKYRIVTLPALGLTTCTKAKLPDVHVPFRDTPVVALDTEMVADARSASAELLRRHLITGQHWITNADSFRATCATVGLAA